MYRIKDKTTIIVSRGDSFSINFRIKNYTFKPDDKVKLSVFEKRSNFEESLMTKYAVIDTSRNIAVFSLLPEDTSFNEGSDRDETFWYEISVNGDQTVIGYDVADKIKPKLFIIMPAEVGDK